MLYQKDEPLSHSHDGEATCAHAAEPETANSHTCPHCSYVNWCTFDQGHSGLCHCDQGHYWQGNH